MCIAGKTDWKWHRSIFISLSLSTSSSPHATNLHFQSTGSFNLWFIQVHFPSIFCVCVCETHTHTHQTTSVEWFIISCHPMRKPCYGMWQRAPVRRELILALHCVSSKKKKKTVEKNIELFFKQTGAVFFLVQNKILLCVVDKKWSTEREKWWNTILDFLFKLTELNVECLEILYLPWKFCKIKHFYLLICLRFLGYILAAACCYGYMRT